MDNKPRAELTALREAFFEAWSKGNWQALTAALADDACLISNQHGASQDPDGWQHALARDRPCLVSMRTSNHATLTGDDGQAACSAYVIGLFTDGQRHLLFGASVVLRFHLDEDKGRWLLRHARLNVNWCRGEPSLVPHWRMPPGDTGWQLGDPAPVLVSELDSPWALIRAAQPCGSTADAIAELYSKYSWAIDQGDIALLADCYTEDAAGGFTPIGALRGRHAIVGQLKSFRRLWPWMQHFAEVVRLGFEPDGRHARMIVARLIPERLADAAGDPVFGAHYQLRARLEQDGQWRICWSDYRPGWFTLAETPEFDLGVTHIQLEGAAT